MNRRSFIKQAALTVATVAAGYDSARARAEAPSPLPSGAATGDLIDSNVYLSRWPYRHLPYDETPRLLGLLHRHGVARAWVGSFDALLQRDISAVNLRLARECAAEGTGRLIPFGAVNPMLPNWEEDVRVCHEVHSMPGLRLHPDFHGYTLEDPRFGRLLELATARGLIVQIVLGMEDPRTQPPTALLAPPHPGPLVDLLPRLPQAKVVLLNYFRTYGANRPLLIRLNSLPQVRFDMAMVEGVGGLHDLLQAVGSVRLLFGSYAPYYNIESSLLKLQESVLTPVRLGAIRSGHASALLPSA